MKVYHPISSLVILLILSIKCLVIGEKNNNSPGEEQFLSSFSARSLVHLRYNTTKSPEADPRTKQTPDETLEVEEIYDGQRNLAKVVVYSSAGKKIELYARPEEGLYMEAQYDEFTGPLTGCRVSQQPPPDGYFGLFSELARVDEQPNYLIGPASIVYRFRRDLPAKWIEQQADTAVGDGEQVLGNNNDDLESDGPNRKRLLMNPNSVQLTSGRKTFTFMRSEFDVERSPLLRDLASFVAYSDAGRDLRVDFLSLNEVDLAAGQKTWDPFRLPGGFECDDAHQELKRDFYRLDKSWPSKLPINSDRMQATLFGANLPTEGVSLLMDLATGLSQINIPDRSSSILDTSKALLYYKPNERSIGSTQELAESQANTADCTILSTGIFLHPQAGDETIRTLGVTILDRWHFLVGHTNHMIYLGQVLYHERRLAHEFQLSYESLDHLPAYFSLMIDKHDHHWASAAYGGILAKLWIAADVLTCADVYSMRSGGCEDFVVLGYRVELVGQSSEGLQVYWRDEIQMVDFQWTSQPERHFKAFDLSHCPMEKLLLTVDVRWMEVSVLKMPEEDAARPPELDDVVANELNDCLHLILSSGNLHILSLERQTKAPGTRLARFQLTIAQYPMQSIGFRLVSKEVSRQSMNGDLVNQVSNRRTLFECLTWASQYSQAIAVLYSPQVEDCFVYSSYRLVNDKQTIVAGEYQLFERRPELTKASNDSLSSFLRDHLDSINSELKQNLKQSNKLEALIDDGNVARDIRLSPLKTASYGRQASVSSNRNQVGYRFANIQQIECNSLVQCQSRCDHEANCNAFAHCKYPDTSHEFCQLNLTNFSGSSNNNFTSSPELTRDAGCEIHSKNYLHYFEPQVSSRSNLWDRDTMNRWHPVVKNISREQDCAMACYSMAAENICMRFIYCTQSETSCLLWLEDVITDKESLEAVGLGAAVAQPDQAGCSLRNRKSISLYRRVLETKSRAFDWQGESLRQSALRNVDQDQCAERCTRNTECSSFDSCLIRQSFNSRTFISLECVQLSGSIFDAGQMHIPDGPNNKSEQSPETSKPETEQQQQQQQQSSQCSHYERLGAKNQLSPRQADLLVATLTTGRRSSGGHSKASFAAGLFGAAVLGLAVGVSLNCLAILWRGQKQRRRHRQLNAANCR